MRNRFVLPAIIVASALCLLRCLWLWQPERQIRLHQEHLLEAVANKKWSRAEGFFHENYSDRWGMDRRTAIERTREVIRHFFVLQIQMEYVAVERTPGEGRVTARLRLDGKGTAIAEIAMGTVNGLKKPFVFEWCQTGWQPWRWRMIRADQPDVADWGD